MKPSVMGTQRLRAKPKAVKTPMPKVGQVKAKREPMPKFTPPSLQDFKKSAAYKTNSMTYKEYLSTAEQVYKAKLKKK